MTYTDDEIRKDLAEPDVSLYCLMVELQKASPEIQIRLCPLVTERLLSSYREDTNNLFLCLVFSERDLWNRYLEGWQAPRCLNYHRLIHYAIWNHEFDVLTQFLYKGHLQYSGYTLVTILVFAFRCKKYAFGAHFAHRFFEEGLNGFNNFACSYYKDEMSKHFIDCATETWEDLDVIEFLNFHMENHIGGYHNFLYNVIMEFYKKRNTRMVRQILAKKSLRTTYIISVNMERILLPGILAMEGAEEKDVLAACENVGWEFSSNSINRYVLLHLREYPYPEAFSFLSKKMEYSVHNRYGHRDIFIIFEYAVKKRDIELLQWLKKWANPEMFGNVQEELLLLIAERLDATIVAEMMVDAKDSTKFYYSLLFKNMEMFLELLDNKEIIAKINISKYIPYCDETFLRLFYESFSRKKLHKKYQKALSHKNKAEIKFIESLDENIASFVAPDDFSRTDDSETQGEIFMSIQERCVKERRKFLKENFQNLLVRSSLISEMDAEIRLNRVEKYLDELESLGEDIKSFITLQISQIDLQFFDIKIEELELFYERGFLDLDRLLPVVLSKSNNENLVIASFLLSKGAKLSSFYWKKTMNPFEKRLFHQYNIKHAVINTSSNEIEEFFTKLASITDAIEARNNQSDESVDQMVVQK